jgi:hypothetical protein
MPNFAAFEVKVKANDSKQSRSRKNTRVAVFKNRISVTIRKYVKLAKIGKN